MWCNVECSIDLRKEWLQGAMAGEWIIIRKRVRVTAKVNGNKKEKRQEGRK